MSISELLLTNTILIIKLQNTLFDGELYRGHRHAPHTNLVDEL